MATCMIAVEIFRQVLIETMGSTIYSRKRADEHDYTAGFFIIAFFGILAAAITFALAHPAEALFGYDNIAPTLQWISIILLVSGLSKMHEIWLVKHLQFKKLAIRSIFTVSIGGGIGIYMAMHGYGLISLITQQLIISIVNLVFLWSATPWRPTLQIRRDRVISILSYWKFMALTSLASMSNAQGDVFFSSYYLGPVMTGIYNAAKRLTAAVQMILGGLHSVALPALASLSHEKKRFQKSFLTTVSMSTIMTAPLYLGIAVLSEDLIAVLMGDKWIETAPVLSLLLISAFFSSAGQYAVHVMLIEDKAHWQTIMGYISAALNIALLIVFARFGLIPLALALLVKNILFLPVNAYLALKLLDLPWRAYLYRILVPTFFALGMVSFISYTKDATDFLPIWNIVVFAPFGALVYAIFYIVFDRRTFMEAYGMARQVLHKSPSANARKE